jgi:3-methylfumaryl-CoA hydratase
MTEALDIDHLATWIGRSETRTDAIAPWPVAALSATLDRTGDPEPGPGTPVPPGWHWLYFLTAAPASELGRDGHPRRGGFLPPVPLPRRMWAGGRLSFHRPLLVGERAEKCSEIADVKLRHGRTGDLVFVVVRHTVTGPDGVAVVEEHDIVYRPDPEPGAAPPPPQAAPEGAEWSREMNADSTMLFRYSALTFNGHRIHYDQPYATGVEGYPGLVVHGPLLATLLLDLIRRHAPDAVVRQFNFRALGTIFDTDTFSVNARAINSTGEGKRLDLWIAGPGDRLAMRAEAELG